MSRTSPMVARHIALGAKLVPFGGWDMPLSYPAGTLAEHAACRTDAALFDVSHLGQVRVRGARAFDALQRCLSNDLAKITPGRAQYSHLLDDADGSVLDDVIVWWLDDSDFEVLPNASNTDRVVAAVVGVAGADVIAEETTETRALLAVQGPRARRRLEEVWPAAAAVGRFRVTRLEWEGVPAVVAGTGYTGEDGVEIAVPADVGEALWDALVSVGIQPAGLGARDTLRLEAGLPLHGHELGPGITSLQAGLPWVIGWDKPQFAGRSAVLAEAETGPSRLLVGLSTSGRRPPRAGQAVLRAGVVVGEVSSGNFSPTLGHGIALAFVEAGAEPGERLTVDARGSLLEAEVVELPFVRRA